MEEEYANKTLAQTNVWHGDKGFFVSTINRRSSAALAQGRIYSETLVWEWDSLDKTRGKLIGQDEHCEDSIFAHQRMVKRLFETGKCEEMDDDCDAVARSLSNAGTAPVGLAAEWQNEAAAVIAQFINLSSHPDEQAWGLVALEATRLLSCEVGN